MLDLFIVTALAFAIIFKIEKLGKIKDRKKFETIEILGTVVVVVIISLVLNALGIAILSILNPLITSALIMRYVWNVPWRTSVAYSFIIFLSFIATSFLFQP